MTPTEDVVCARIQLQPGSLPRVRAWAEHLRTHREEALQTLAAEGDFLVYYMRSGSQQRAQEVAARSLAAIDAYHRAFKRDTWAAVRPLDLLLDLSCAPSRKD